MGNVTTIAEGGAEIVRSEEDAALLGSQVQDPGVAEQRAAAEQRRLMFHTADDAVTTFVEGAVDALSLGLIRETGDVADLRRAENQGAALAGNVVGFAAGMGLGGPVRGVTRTSEALGNAAARSLLRVGEKSIAARAVTEATASAALAGGQAFGHQLMDALLEDKEFSAEAIVDEVKLAGIMGAVGGVALGGLSKLGRRAEVAGQGGLVGDLDEALTPHREATRAYDDVVTRHAAEIGAMRQLEREGLVAKDALKARTGALNNAARARDALDRINEAKALSGTDDVAYKKWQAAGVRYRAAVRELDAVMQQPVASPRADLDRLNALIEQLPVKSDVPATLRFADTPEPTFAPESRESPLRANEPDRGTMTPDLTPAQRPVAARRPDVGTRELPVDQEMVGQRRPVMNANDLPDIYQPGGTHAGQPDVPTTPGKLQVAEPMIPEAPVRPLDVAEARVQAAMAELEAKAQGRLTSAAGTGILEQAGIRPAADNVGAYMDQVYALRKVARQAATPGKTQLKDALGAAIAGGMGHALGGPLGAVTAVAADLMYLKRGGRIASAAGRLASRVTGAAEKLLSARKVRASAAAVANVAYAYSDKGPIEDPVERIQEIQFLAAHPDAIMERVAGSARDVADEPQLLAALQARAVTQLQRLSMRAPAIYFDKLGRALSPPVGRLRDFLEYEGAVHDLDGVLKAVGNGTVTRAQADALRDNWSSVSVKMAAAFLKDPERLRNLSREQLRVVEMVSGLQLTNSADPMFIARQVQAWTPPAPPEPPKPQAFNINPAGAPTPSQSNATGRAPGN